MTDVMAFSRPSGYIDLIFPLACFDVSCMTVLLRMDCVSRT